MARSNETTNSQSPALNDQRGFRHFGDTIAGEIVAARIQGYDSGNLVYTDIAVDSSGNLKLAANVTVDIGVVDQGGAGSSAWKVTDAALVALTDGTLRGTVIATGPLTDTQLRASAVPVSLAAVPSHAVTNAGTFAVQQTKPATGTTSSPASVTTTVATVLASNPARYGATVYNESGAVCYIKLGATATLTDYTLQIAIGGYYEVPFAYTGIITGITSTGTAVLRVTEVTT